MIFPITTAQSSTSSTTTEMIRNVESRDRREKINDLFVLQDRFRQFAGPGHWNDPDMLIVGNHWPKPKLPGLSLEQVIA